MGMYVRGKDSCCAVLGERRTTETATIKQRVERTYTYTAVDPTDRATKESNWQVP